MKNKVYNIYRNLYLKHGDNPASVKARTAKQQEMRFKHLIDCAEITSSDSILDVGSGLGNFLTYIRKKNYNVIIQGLIFMKIL